MSTETPAKPLLSVAQANAAAKTLTDAWTFNVSDESAEGLVLQGLSFIDAEQRAKFFKSKAVSALLDSNRRMGDTMKVLSGGPGVSDFVAMNVLKSGAGVLQQNERDLYRAAVRAHQENPEAKVPVLDKNIVGPGVYAPAIAYLLVHAPGFAEELADEAVQSVQCVIDDEGPDDLVKAVAVRKHFPPEIAEKVRSDDRVMAAMLDEAVTGVTTNWRELLFEREEQEEAAFNRDRKLRELRKLPDPVIEMEQGPSR